ncbi:hypothetical protein H0H92_007349 [Tricholoma furcatifolium]|nr:hypothetical protein H0H92_007349 [Tricholoma furcatifolium]
MLSALESLAALPACKRPLVSASVLVAIFVASRLFKFVKGLRAVSNLPGLRVPFEPILPPGAILPITWWNPSNLFTWNWRKTLYQRNDTFSVVPFLMGLPAIYTSNMDVFRQVLTGENSRTVWHKWDVTFSVLEKWGPNVLSLYGGEPWRRHRRAVGPAFNNDLHQEVWNETLITYRQMVEDEGWSNQNVIEIPGIQTYTTKLALLVMSKCGFGLQYDWSSPPTDPDGNMSIQESLRLLADTFMLDFVFPSWVLNHFPSFAQRREAFRALTGFLKQRIALRIDEVRSGSQATDERTDIFTLIVRANVQDSGKVVLDEEEVNFIATKIGNVFALLFAGHETTARTMSAVLSLLALHQDIQEEMVEHIISVIGYDREPDYEDYEKLNKVLSLFFESLRLFPTTYLTLRISGKDSVLDIPNPIGEEGSTRIAVEENTLFIEGAYNPACQTAISAISKILKSLNRRDGMTRTTSLRRSLHLAPVPEPASGENLLS